MSRKQIRKITKQKRSRSKKWTTIRQSIKRSWEYKLIWMQAKMTNKRKMEKLFKDWKQLSSDITSNQHPTKMSKRRNYPNNRGNWLCRPHQLPSFLFFSRLINYYYSIVIFCWGIAALQCCVSFCWTTKWISSMHISPPSWTPCHTPFSPL